MVIAHTIIEGKIRFIGSITVLESDHELMGAVTDHQHLACGFKIDKRESIIQFTWAEIEYARDSKKPLDELITLNRRGRKDNTIT